MDSFLAPVLFFWLGFGLTVAFIAVKHGWRQGIVGLRTGGYGLVAAVTLQSLLLLFIVVLGPLALLLAIVAKISADKRKRRQRFN